MTLGVKSGIKPQYNQPKILIVLNTAACLTGIEYLSWYLIFSVAMTLIGETEKISGETI